ncbi:MAG: hypothetical protein WD513_02065 [Balneolaceae bacterium]
MSNVRDELNRSVLQERVNLLKDQGYRGFTTVGGRSKPAEIVQITAENEKGIQFTAEGETPDEAYENLIERIDLMMDD